MERRLFGVLTGEAPHPTVWGFSRIMTGMATEAEIEEARRRSDGAADYTDDQISDFLDRGNTVFDFARLYWESKAASYSTLADVTESGSTRKLSDLHKNALAMAKHFGTDTAAEEVLQQRKGSRPAVRR